MLPVFEFLIIVAAFKVFFLLLGYDKNDEYYTVNINIKQSFNYIMSIVDLYLYYIIVNFITTNEELFKDSNHLINILYILLIWRAWYIGNFVDSIFSFSKVIKQKVKGIDPNEHR